MFSIKSLGEALGKYIADNVEKKFPTLREALEHMFWWEENFGIKVNEDGSIVSDGKCPIYRYYPKWCDDACIVFIERVAEKYGYSVKRVKKMPESEICEFIFEKRG